MMLGACIGTIAWTVHVNQPHALVGIVWGLVIGILVGPLFLPLVIMILNSLVPRRDAEGETIDVKVRDVHDDEK